MNLSNSLYNTLLSCYPDLQAKIIRIFSESSPQELVTKVTAEDGAQVGTTTSDGYGNQKFPNFGILMDRIKAMLGNDQFRLFIDYYVNKEPQNNQLIKEELYRLEKEALTLETKEQEKFSNIGLPMPPFESREGPQLFQHSSLNDNMMEEFKEAKWVVLTSPLIQSKGGSKNQAPLQRENSLNLASLSSSGNFTIQLQNLGQNSNRQQSSNNTASTAQQAQAAALAKQQNQPPQKRYGHSACLVKNKMYIFGGLASHQKGGNLQTFFECQLKFANSNDDITSGNNSQLLFQWDKIKAEAPRARDSHTVIHVGDSLIMFGGSGGTSSFNDLYKFDLRQQKWHKLEPYGELPPPREGHIAKLIGKDKMMIHGGVDQNETSFGDTYILSGISQFIDNAQISSIYAAYIPASELGIRQPSTPGQDSIQYDSYSGDVQVSDVPQNYNQQTDSIQGSVPFKPSSTVSLDNLRSAQKGGTLKSAPEKLRWFKCDQRGPVPQGRDSHSSALINNKVYIFGGQGDGDIIFDDLYSCQILEEQDQRGNTIYIAQWELIEPQTEKGALRSMNKPRGRTSHSCTVYKNRYMIIVGGEGELDESELATMKAQQPQTKKSGGSRRKRQQNEDEIQVDLDPESGGESDSEGSKKPKNLEEEENEENKEEDEKKRMLNDIWIYDTLTQKWHEIQAPLKLQGPLSGKKLKREFEARMAHSAVQLNQFLVLFGGLGNDALVSNDLYVLSLDGNLGSISQAIEPFADTTQSSTAIQIPNLSHHHSRTSAPIHQDVISIPMPQTSFDSAALLNSSARLSRQSSMTVSIPQQTQHQHQLPQTPQTSKSTTKQQQQLHGNNKTLKIGNPEDRKVMSGQILNQIINYNQGLTHQFIITGGSVTNNMISQPQDLGPSQRINVPKRDSEVQTLLDLPTPLTDQAAIKADNKKQAIMITQKQNDYRLSGFQRTRFAFIKTLAEQIVWPLQCFGALIDNSIESFDSARQKLEATKINGQTSAGQNMAIQIQNQLKQTLEIEINLKLSNVSENGQSSSNYLEIKDNGTGIHPKQLMEALTAFGSSTANLKSKSDFNFAEHGIGLKLACLRLASSTLIITKTRPISEFGTTTYFLSIGLLSSDFMKKADSMNGYLTAPIVSFEIKNRKITRYLTPEPDHFLQMISQFTKPKFDSGEKILQYALNGLGESGATHVLMFNLSKQRLEKNGPEICELQYTQGDITLNSSLFTFPKSSTTLMETTLANYLPYLYVEFPAWVRIKINGTYLSLKNPYSILKTTYPQSYVGLKQDKFAIQLLDETLLTQVFSQCKMSDGSDVKQEIHEAGEKSQNIADPQPFYSQIDAQPMAASLQQKVNAAQEIQEEEARNQIKKLQGVLVYRGNRLIRRLETVFGEDEDQVLTQSMRKASQESFTFKTNAIVSVYKSRSTTNLDKKDFTEKLIVRKIKEWFRQRNQTSQEEQPVVNNSSAVTDWTTI